MILIVIVVVGFFLLTGAAKPKLTGEAPLNPAAPTLSAEQKAKDEWNNKHTATREDGRDPAKSAVSAEYTTQLMWEALNGVPVGAPDNLVVTGIVDTLNQG